MQDAPSNVIFFYHFISHNSAHFFVCGKSLVINIKNPPILNICIFCIQELCTVISYIILLWYLPNCFLVNFGIELLIFEILKCKYKFTSTIIMKFKIIVTVTFILFYPLPFLYAPFSLIFSKRVCCSQSPQIDWN